MRPMARHAEFAPFRRLLAALLLALTAACALGGEGASPLRFDGLYVSDDPETSPRYRSYIRFYPDGAVAMASVNEPASPQQIATWLSPAHAWSASGTYDVRGGRIFLSVSARTPTVDAAEAGSVANSYQGLIRGDVILLDNNVGGVSIVTYRFAEVALEQ
jgi:hypothetical protein